MKHSKFLKFSILGLLPVVMSIGVVSARQETLTKVDAYTNYTEGTLPTTIDLNDASDETIRNYYSALNGKGLNGTNLLKALKPILSNGQKYFSYDSTSPKNAIWKAYEIVDRDWNLSPASEIDGYNPSTNIITGYTYKASTNFNDSKNPYLHALYVNRNMDNPIKAWGNHNQTTGGINQEHIWPKSHGFDTSNSGGARGDLMHLWAADGYTNKIHSNYSYGNVDKTKSYDTMVDTIYYSTDNYLGTSKRLGSGTVFEPQDCDKGDIARALFYMAARYNNYAGATEGIDSNDPYLVLKDITSPAMQPGSTCTATQPGEYGILSDLLEWNRLDPVDEFEIHRNNILFNTYTKNRNPFIDFPEWAELVWGNNQTGSASPATDTINGGASEEEEETGTFTKATSLSIGDKVAVASEGAGMELTSISSTSTPYGIGTKYTTNIKGDFVFDVVAGSTDSTYAFKNGTKYLNWSSGNSLNLSSTPSTNSSWTVTFDGDNNAKLTNVKDSNRSLIWNSAANGQRFACYTDYNTKISGSSYKTIQLYKKDMSTPVTGVELDASTAEVEVGKTIQLSAIVSPKKASNKDVTWSSSTPTVASVDNGKISALKAGTTQISVTTVDGSFTDSCLVTVVNPPVVESISIGGDYSTLYAQGEEYSEDGLIVLAHLDNGNDVDVTSKATITSADTSIPGKKTITATHSGKNATANVFVYNKFIALDSSLGYENKQVVTNIESGEYKLEFIKNGANNNAAYYISDDCLHIYNKYILKVSGAHKIANVTFSYVRNTSVNSNVVSSTNGTMVSENSWVGSQMIPEFNFQTKFVNGIYITYDSGWEFDQLKIEGTPKNLYDINEPLDLSGVVVKAVAKDGVSATLLSTDYTVTGFDTSTQGNKAMTLSYTDNYGITKTATINYAVKDLTLTKIELEGTPKAEFKYGEDFSLGTAKVKATYASGDTDYVTASVTHSGYNKNTLGTQTITLKYTVKSVTKQLTYQVSVVDYVSSITISGAYYTEYEIGTEFDPRGLKVTAHYAGPTEDKVVDVSELTFSELDTSKIGAQKITITYQGVSASYDVEIVEPSGSLLDMLGCSGSIAASAGIVSLASLLGAGLILLKKKED